MLSPPHTHTHLLLVPNAIPPNPPKYICIRRERSKKPFSPFLKNSFVHRFVKIYGSLVKLLKTHGTNKHVLKRGFTIFRQYTTNLSTFLTTISKIPILLKILNANFVYCCWILHSETRTVEWGIIN